MKKFSALKNCLTILWCLSWAFFPSSAGAAGAWIAEWDLPSALREVKNSNFRDIILFAAYFNSKDTPFLPATLKDFLDASPAYYIKPGQGFYLSVVNDRFDERQKATQKDPALVKRLMATKESREKHQKDLLSLLAKGPFTGLEIDYEKVDMDDWPKLLAFSAELHAKLAAQGKKLRFLLEPKQKYLKDRLPAGPEYVLMGYNLFGTHSGPGPKADSAFLNKLAGWCSHMPAKPAIALATGGFAWIEGQKTLGITESKARAWAEGGKARQVRDNKSGCLKFTSTDDAPDSAVPKKDASGAKCEIWYADGQTLLKLAEDAKSYGFSNVYIWRLGGNTQESLETLAKIMP